MAVFTVNCVGIAWLSEILGLKTSIPFGSYSLTSAIGPQMFGLPFLLVLAYLGIAYCSWTLALLILGIAKKPFQSWDTLSAPLLASSIFLAWDLSMEPDWSTVDRAGIWRQGGPYFGVPLGNFFGWFVTAWLFFFLLAIYLKGHSSSQRDASLSFWRYPIALYGVCAAGNLLIHFRPMAPEVVFDPTGKAWHTQTILLVDSAV